MHKLKALDNNNKRKVSAFRKGLISSSASNNNTLHEYSLTASGSAPALVKNIGDDETGASGTIFCKHTYRNRITDSNVYLMKVRIPYPLFRL